MDSSSSAWKARVVFWFARPVGPVRNWARKMVWGKWHKMTESILKYYVVLCLDPIFWSEKCLEPATAIMACSYRLKDVSNEAFSKKWKKWEKKQAESSKKNMDEIMKLLWGRNCVLLHWSCHHMARHRIVGRRVGRDFPDAHSLQQVQSHAPPRKTGAKPGQTFRALLFFVSFCLKCHAQEIE